MLARGLWQQKHAQRRQPAYQMKLKRLEKFLAPVIELPIGLINADAITRCCHAFDTDERPAFNTRTDGRRRAKAFFAWCVEQRVLKRTPFEKRHSLAHQPQKRKRLRIDECRQLRVKVDPAALGGDRGAAFVLTSLLLGPRSNELMHTRVESLDDNGTRLSYMDIKDKHTVHEVVLPEILVAVFDALAKNAEDGWLFGKPTARRLDAWPAEMVRKWTQAAGIHHEGIDTRWLRRTKDSVAVESGLAAEAVARATGHTVEVARKHYISAGAETSGRAAALAENTAPESVGNGTGTKNTRTARRK